MTIARVITICLAGALLLPRPAFPWVQIHVGDEGTNPPIVGRQPAASIPVRFQINEQGVPSITDDSDLKAIRNAFFTWQNVNTATISFIDDGTTTQANGNSNDGISLITFVDTQNALPAGAVAVTLNIFDTTTGEMSDADILFSPDEAFSTTGAADTFDIQSVAVHEIGHLCGLDHILMMSTVMYPFTDKADRNKLSLAQDDIAGISAIYPSSSFNSSTGSISGTVRSNNTPVFAGHVVAVDTGGRPSVSTVIDSTDGTYKIQGLPAGTYAVFVEPYDGPASNQELTGGAFDRAFTTNFNTTFFNDNETPTVTVTKNNERKNVNITADEATTVNLTDIGKAATGQNPPLGNTPVFVQPGDEITLGVTGTGIAATGTVEISGSGVVPTNVVIANNAATMTLTVSANAAEGARLVSFRDGGQLTFLTGGLVVGTASGDGGGGGDGGGVAPPTPGRFQIGAGDGFIDVEWVDPSGQFEGMIVAVGDSRFPALMVDKGQVIVNPVSGTEAFRGKNGRRLTISPVFNGARRFVTFATFQGTSFSLAGAATTRAVSGGDGINCVESFFGLGDCPEGATPGGGGGGCFVATAVYGTPQATDIDGLRELRDRWLNASKAGKAFVQTYYSNSPVAASWLQRQTTLRRLLACSLFAPLECPVAISRQGDAGAPTARVSGD